MKKCIMIAMMILSTHCSFSDTLDSSSTTAQVIKEMHVNTVNTTQVKVLRSVFNEYFTTPEKVPADIRSSFDDLIKRAAKETAPTGPIEKGHNGLTAFTIALRFSDDLQPSVIESLVLRTDMPVPFRSNALEKLHEEQLNDSMARVGEILSKSSDPEDRALAVHSYLNIGELTRDQADYVLGELESGKSRAMVRLSLPPEVKMIYKATNDAGRQKIDQLITQGKIKLPNDRLNELREIKKAKKPL